MGDLPKGWTWIKLEEIAIISPRHPRDLDESMQVSFIPMPAIDDNCSQFKFTQIKTLSEVKKGYTHFAEGDVLFAKITPCMENGKAAIARNLVNKLGCGTTELHVIRPLLNIPAEYIYHFIHQELFRTKAANHMTGTAGQLRVPTDYIKSHLIPLPPLNEQCRIVAKLEKLLAKVNACQERLDKIPTILKRFRQSVLAAACSGRLTADWREQHPDIEPAEELLKRIQEERIRRYEEECEKAKAEGKRKPKAHFAKGSLITDHELNIPSSWTVSYLGNITDAQGGIQKTPKRTPVNNPYPYLRVANVYRGYLNLDEIEYFELFDSKELDKWKLKKGDLLVVEGNGSPTEIGRCALWNEEIPN